MKNYDENTYEEILNPDLSNGYLYDGTIVTGTTEARYEVMEGTITKDRPDGLRKYIPSEDIVEQCKYYHAYLEEEKDEIKNRKVDELSYACNQAITNGADIKLSDGSEKHFTYSIEDQANISEMFNAVLLGASSYPYHANSDDCMMYSSEDIISIYSTLSALKTSQTTYFNQLRKYVKTLTDISKVQSVEYGQELTGEYLLTYSSLMQNAKEQMEAILSNVSKYSN